MNSQDYAEVVDDALRRQRDTLRWYLLFAAGMVGLGMLIVVLVVITPRSVVPADQKWLMTLGGTFISSLCSFPLHQVTAARSRLGALGTLERLVVRAVARGELLDPRIEERVLKILDG